MTVGEDETVPVHPLGVLGVELHEAGEQDMGSRSHALKTGVSIWSYHRSHGGYPGDNQARTARCLTHHGSTGVTRVSLSIRRNKNLCLATAALCPARSPTHLANGVNRKGADGAAQRISTIALCESAVTHLTASSSRASGLKDILSLV